MKPRKTVELELDLHPSVKSLRLLLRSGAEFESSVHHLTLVRELVLFFRGQLLLQRLCDFVEVLTGSCISYPLLLLGFGIHKPLEPEVLRRALLQEPVHAILGRYFLMCLHDSYDPCGAIRLCH